MLKHKAEKVLTGECSSYFFHLFALIFLRLCANQHGSIARWPQLGVQITDSLKSNWVYTAASQWSASGRAAAPKLWMLRLKKLKQGTKCASGQNLSILGPHLRPNLRVSSYVGLSARPNAMFYEPTATQTSFAFLSKLDCICSTLPNAHFGSNVSSKPHLRFCSLLKSFVDK